jgi:hypothetical protein
VLPLLQVVSAHAPWEGTDNLRCNCASVLGLGLWGNGGCVATWVERRGEGFAVDGMGC